MSFDHYQTLPQVAAIESGNRLLVCVVASARKASRPSTFCVAEFSRADRVLRSHWYRSHGRTSDFGRWGDGTLHRIAEFHRAIVPAISRDDAVFDIDSKGALRRLN